MEIFCLIPIIGAAIIYSIIVVASGDVSLADENDSEE